MVEGFQILDQELGSRADGLAFRVQDLKLSSLNSFVLPLVSISLDFLFDSPLSEDNVP